jgi:hypothetical protein
MRRKLLLFILIPALLLLGGYLYLRYSLKTAIRTEEKRTGEILPQKDILQDKKLSGLDLRPLFIQRLRQLIQSSSQGLYDLSVGGLEVDLIASTVHLSNVTVRPNLQNLKTKVKPSDIFSLSFKRIDIEGINLDDAVTSKTMDYKSIRVVQPVIDIRHNSKQKSSGAFAQGFLKEMEKLSIRKLEIEDGLVIIHSGHPQPTILHKVSVVMRDVLLDETTRTDPGRFLFAKTAQIRFHDYRTQTKDGLYNLSAAEVAVKAPEQQVVISKLSFMPTKSRRQFTRSLKQSKELYRLSMPSVVISRVDWWKLINEEEIIADDVLADNGKLSIYFDRSLPPRSRMGQFPNQLLMKLPVRMDIAQLRLHHLDLSYEEFNPISQQSGIIYLDKATVDMHHISTLPNSREPVTVKANALFMHRLPIQADFTFDRVDYRSGAFTAKIRSDVPFGGDLVNSFAVPLGLTRIEKGSLKTLSADIKGNQWEANGQVTITYNDLKLALLEKDRSAKPLDKKDVTTFLANVFVLKKDNPGKGQAPRQELAEFKRDPNGGFFKLVWKTMLVGALRTIGAPVKIARKSNDVTVVK